MRTNAPLSVKIKTIACSITPVIGVFLITQFMSFERQSLNQPKSNLVTTSITAPSTCAVHKNHETRYKQLLKAVKNDDAVAAFQLARIYKKTKGADCQKYAFRWFSKSSIWGEPKAYAELGNAYRKGRGVDVNFEKASEFFYKSAQHNFVSSVFSLIQLWEKGISEHKPNPTRARQYLSEFMPLIQKGIDEGNAIAARSLARLNYRSKLLKRDIKRAIYLYEIASAAGDPIAKHDLALIFLKHKKTKIFQQRAVELLHESAELNYAASFTALGRLHLKSAFGLPKQNALHWFESGAERGHGGALQELAKLYLAGDLVEHNYEKALGYAMEGQKLGHRGASRLLLQMQELSALATNKENIDKKNPGKES